MKKPRKPRPSVLERLLDSVIRNPVTGCWESQFAPCNNQYHQKGSNHPRINVGGKMRFVHRVAYALMCADPGEMRVLHECDNPKCIKPTHLKLGTYADNNRDRASRGRNGRSARWTRDVREQVAAALDAGEPKSQIAVRLGLRRRGVQLFAKRRKAAAEAAAVLSCVS